MNKTPSKQLALQPDQSVAAMLAKIIDKGITAENVQALDIITRNPSDYYPAPDEIRDAYLNENTSFHGEDE